jgi:hypothetical protein
MLSGVDSPKSNAELKKAWSFTSSTYVFLSVWLIEISEDLP